MRFGNPAFKLRVEKGFSLNKGRPSWAPPGALFAADLLGGRYWRTSRPTCVRASDGYAQTAGGVWVKHGAHELRLTDKGLLVPEPSQTEIVSNNQMTGAAVGTNSMPTSWITASTDGDRQVVGVGNQDGIPTIDIRLHSFGAPVSGSWWIVPGTYVVMSGTPTMHYHLWAALIAAPAFAGVTRVTIQVENTAGAPAVLGKDIVLTGDLANYAASPAGTIVTLGSRGIRPLLRFTGVGSAPRDFTIRLGWPSLRASPIDSPIATTGTAPVVRAADTVSIDAPSGGYNLHLVMGDASEQVINGWTPATPLPLNLPQGKYITSYYGVAA